MYVVILLHGILINLLSTMDSILFGLESLFLFEILSYQKTVLLTRLDSVWWP